MLLKNIQNFVTAATPLVSMFTPVGNLVIAVIINLPS